MKMSGKNEAAEQAMRQKIADLELKRLKQKECETKALHIVERLLDNPVHDDFLKEACQFISPSHYTDVTEERALGDLCGYPLCQATNTKRPNQTYRIDTKTNKVYDITERKNFCSNGCYKSSKYLAGQISSTPVWLRDHQPRVQFTVLPPGGHSGPSGDVVIEHPSAEIATELAGISLTDQSQPRVPVTSQSVSATNQSESSIPETSESVSATNQSESSIPETSKSVSETDQSEPAMSARTQSSVLDSDDDSGDENAGNAEKSAKTTTDRKLEDLMKLIDRRDQLIKQLRADAQGKKSTKTSRNLNNESVVPSETQLKSELDSGEEAKVTLALEMKSIHSETNCETDAIKPVLSPIPPSHCLAPRQKVEKFLSEWISERTLSYLSGKCEVNREEVMERLDAKLRDEERIERALDKEDRRTSPHGSMPDIEALKQRTAEFEVRVRSFYSPARKPAQEQEPVVRDDVTEGLAADWSPVVPLVDSQSQATIRRKIVLDALNKTLPSVLRLLCVTSGDVTPGLKALVRTFNFTKENIVLKPGEWMLMTVYLLSLMSRSNDVIREALTSREKDIDDVIAAHDVTLHDVTEWVSGRVTGSRDDSQKV